ncbi:MAG: acylphosphatase [Pseudomonadota bacterium]
MARLSCLVSGRVQGVGFRAAAKREAQRLGLVGFARNRPDGGVDVVASGEPTAIHSFRQWLEHGPRLATVDAVVDATPSWEAFFRFEVR